MQSETYKNIHTNQKGEKNTNSSQKGTNSAGKVASRENITEN